MVKPKGGHNEAGSPQFRKAEPCTGILILAALLLSATAALAGPQDNLVAAEHAFSVLAQAQGHAAAYLAYLAEDAADFGAGTMTPIYGRAAFEASVRSGAAANPAGSVLRWNRS